MRAGRRAARSTIDCSSGTGTSGRPAGAATCSSRPCGRRSGRRRHARHGCRRTEQAVRRRGAVHLHARRARHRLHRARCRSRGGLEHGSGPLRGSDRWQLAAPEAHVGEPGDRHRPVVQPRRDDAGVPRDGPSRLRSRQADRHRPQLARRRHPAADRRLGPQRREARMVARWADPVRPRRGHRAARLVRARRRHGFGDAARRPGPRLAGEGRQRRHLLQPRLARGPGRRPRPQRRSAPQADSVERVKAAGRRTRSDSSSSRSPAGTARPSTATCSSPPASTRRERIRSPSSSMAARRGAWATTGTIAGTRRSTPAPDTRS